MGTKVKGDAIKEGSIPLSALATEVKDKIENAGGGADWNAQKGEAGYIENKPFSKKHISKVLNDYNYDDEWGRVIHAAADGLESINVTDENIVFTSIGNYELTYPFYVPKILGNYTVTNKYGQQFTLGVVDYDNLLYVEIYGGDEDILHIEYDIVTFLSSAYIDDTVLKTTPQTLSDTDKNQALANLGIDPIVLKYLCNPYIACVEGIEEDIEEVPEDLRSIIIKDDALSDIVLNLVYFKDMSDSDEPIYRTKAKNYDKLICDNFTVTYNYSTNKFYKYYD